MYHSVTVVGHLGQDPEMRYLQSGKAVCNFSVATSKKWMDGEGNQREKKVWWRISAFGKNAEACKQYLKKGSLALVRGELNADETGNPRSFQKKDGSFGTSFELIADTVRFLSPKRNSDPQTGEIKEEGGEAEDIPF